MRVVGGRLKGRNIAAPTSRDIRPTADRLRESVFNILVHAYDNPIDGARVLDLFAGTGALGIEAVSRGAAFALFVDNGAEARALLRNNVEALALGGVSKVYRRDATDLGPAHPMQPFSLAFLDPPYGKGLAEKSLASLRDGGWLVADALVMVEEAKAAGFAAPEGFEELERRAYDDTEFVFLRARLTAIDAVVVAKARTHNHSSMSLNRLRPQRTQNHDGVMGPDRRSLRSLVRDDRLLEPHRRPNSLSMSASFSST